MPVGPSGSKRALLRSQEALRLLSRVPLPHPWQREGWCLFRSPDMVPGVKIAAFDFDKTLHYGGSAWKLSSSHVPGKFKELCSRGYKIVIFSNQHGPGRQKTPEAMVAEVTDIISRFDDFACFCEVPVQIFVAAARGDVGDPFRKPGTAMWDLLTSRCNGGIVPDVLQSFYVGNSAGRRADGNDVDRAFAERLGLPFYTEAFLSDLVI
mmetsp:Transcript_5801/g.10410  ORF Transcript_5801/g.10410 Transcript_5801/m.10410 type:complete len:208 (+) Transcript_5801:126-749(+)